MILLIDNYDSFVHNLARYLRRLGQETVVIRNDAITVEEIRQMNPAAIVLSPGPCTPGQAGCSLGVVRQLHESFAMLGICLGHQCIAEALGGVIVRCEPMHGRVSEISHNQQEVFAGLPNPLTVCRYHSLAIEPSSLPTDLKVTATTEDGVIMAIRHQQLPVVGLQFHPEAILTNCGLEMLSGFLKIANIQHDRSNIAKNDELLAKKTNHLQSPSAGDPSYPDVPVTF